MKLGKLVTGLIGIVYRRVFSREMSAAEGDFAQSLSWVGIGTFIATALIAIFSVLGGRLLGPEEYGKFMLVQSIAMFLHIPMVMGLDVAMLKYNAEGDDANRRKSITSTAYAMIAGLAAVSVAVMLLLAGPLSGWFAAEPDLFRFSVYFALLYSFFTLTQTTLRSIDRMRPFAISQPVHAVILLIAFASFIILNRLSFAYMVYAKLIAFAGTGVAIHVLHSRQYLVASFDTAWARTLTRFAFATLMTLVAVAFYGNIGNVIVARYMSVADVGLYGAYFTSTMSIASIGWQIFNMVFFPTASRYRDKRPLLRRINRLVPIVIILGTPLIMGAGYVILQLYGGEYSFSIVWLALFAAASVLFIARGFYSSLLTSAGPGGAFLVSTAAVITAAIMVTLSILLVPVLGIAGAMAAAIAAYLTGTAVLLWRGHRYLHTYEGTDCAPTGVSHQ